MKHYKAIIVSDVHLGTEDCKAVEFLEFLNNHHTDILIINGDFVDGWALSRGVRWRAKHTKVKQIRNYKKEQMMEARFTEIERDNRILLEKMTSIMKNGRGNRPNTQQAKT